MSTIKGDQNYIQNGIEDLESYLLSSEVFWPLSGGKDLPRLTIGGLLLSLVRLQARASSPNRAADLHRMENALGEIRSKRRAAWEHKAGQEVHTRIVLWRNYLTDYQQSPDQQAGNYPHEVSGRVCLQLLKKEFTKLPPDFGTLEDLDQLVKGAWRKGPFLWERDLVRAFPETEFWFLYGKLHTREGGSVDDRSK